MRVIMSVSLRGIVGIRIKEGIPDDQALALSRGALDMLLGPLPIAGSDLNVQPLFRERLFVVAASDHPLTKLQNLRCEHLQGAHVLSLDRRHHLHREVATICTAFGMELLRDYEGTSLDSIHQMSASGIGLAILPELYIRSDVAGRTGVAVLQPEGWHFTRSIAAAWRSGAAYGDAYRMIAERIGTEASALTGANGGLFRE